MDVDFATLFDYNTPSGLALLASNLVWLVVVMMVLKGKKEGLSGKFTDTDWARELDRQEAVVTKEGRGDFSNEGELFVPYKAYKKYGAEDMVKRGGEFFKMVNGRRTVREYSEEKFPRSVLEDCIRAAGTAPSGANLQPWTYVIVENPEVKSNIRAIVEDEEAVNYARRMRDSWKADLAHLGTDANKPYLDTAPYLVCVFKHTYRIEEDERLSVYYPEQSVGISVGIFQTALHNAGLVTLTSTPMGAESAIRELLDRPANERLYLLMPVGFPVDDVKIPNITRKPLDKISAVV